MRILITGVTGYLGSSLARALAGRHQVYGLVREPVRETYLAGLRPELTLLPYDGSYASMQKAVAQCRPDLIYHLAAYYIGTHTQADVLPLLQSNVAMGAYLLEAACSLGCGRLVYASTVTEFDRDGSYRPLSLYAATKRAFRDLAAYYQDTGALGMITLVLSDTYGPGDLRPKVLNRVREAICTGQPLSLSAGDQEYDAVYIDDVVRAFVLAGEELLRDPGRKDACYQVFSAAPIPLRQAIEKLVRISGRSPDLIWGQRTVSPRALKQAVRLFPAVPGWSAGVSWDEGLTRFWNGGAPQQERGMHDE
jgi:nucleoside-diphosphate-sugar epimerase